MAAVHVKFECRECPFVTTDSLEAHEHSDAERHCIEVSGEILPRVGLLLRGDNRAVADASGPRGFEKQRRQR